MCQQRDEEADRKPAYTPISMADTQLGEIALEDAAQKGGAPPFYTLLVGPQLKTMAVVLARKMNAVQVGNVLAPYINIQVEPRYLGTEWCLITPRGAFGSKGC